MTLINRLAELNIASCSEVIMINVVANFSLETDLSKILLSEGLLKNRNISLASQ